MSDIFKCIYCGTELTMYQTPIIKLPYCDNLDCSRYGLVTLKVMASQSKEVEKPFILPKPIWWNSTFKD